MNPNSNYYINTCIVCNKAHMCECMSNSYGYGFYCEIDADLKPIPVKYPQGFSVRSIMKKYIRKNEKKEDLEMKPTKQNDSYMDIESQTYMETRPSMIIKNPRKQREMPILQHIPQLLYGCVYIMIIYACLY